MIGLSFARLIYSHVRVAAGSPKVLYVTQQMTVGVLRTQIAEMHADSKKCNRRLAHRPTFNRKPTNQDKTSARKNVVK